MRNPDSCTSTLVRCAASGRGIGNLATIEIGGGEGQAVATALERLGVSNVARVSILARIFFFFRSRATIGAVLRSRAIFDEIFSKSWVFSSLR